MKVLQIRGSGGSGKTATCRQYVVKNGLKCVEVPVTGAKGAKSHIMKSPDNQVVVLGRYDKKIGGCDLFDNRKQVLDVILWTIQNIAPKVIIFEGLIYSTYKFATEVCAEVKKFGYEYSSVTLATPPNVAIKRLYKRNGGKQINESNVESKYKSVMNVHERLVAEGYKDLLVDTSFVRAELMWENVEKGLRM